MFPISNVVSKPTALSNAATFEGATHAYPLALVVWKECPVEKVSENVRASFKRPIESVNGAMPEKLNLNCKGNFFSVL